MKKKLKWIICILSFIIFLIISILVFNKKDLYIDYISYNFVSRFISNNFTLLVKVFTYLGSALMVIGITILTFIIFKNKKYSLFMAIDLILITIFQYILKYIFSRPRPIDINIIEETGYSFPSGHSLTALAFYGFIIYLIYISKINKRKKVIFITLFSLVILLIGFSRIYLGVHYFTDILGAYSFSLTYLIIYINLIKSKLGSE